MRNNSKSMTKEKLQLFYDIVSKDEKLQSKVTLALSNEVKQLEKEKAELGEKLNKEVC